MSGGSGSGRYGKGANAALFFKKKRGPVDWTSIVVEPDANSPIMRYSDFFIRYLKIPPH
jgi:hypothetical protein